MPAASATVTLDSALLTEIAADQGTPVYVYDGRVLDAGVRRWVDAVGDLAAALKEFDTKHNASPTGPERV